MNLCKGTCRLMGGEAARRGAGGHLYMDGTKRCNICAVFMKCPGFRCPCCGTTLRSHPRRQRRGDGDCRARGATWGRI